MNISSCYVRLMRVKVNLYPFHRRKYAWDEFLLFVDVLYFILGCSRLLHVIDIKFWICGPGNLNITMPYVIHTHKNMRQNTSIAPYFEALKVGLHIFFFSFYIMIRSICVISNMVLLNSYKGWNKLYEFNEPTYIYEINGKNLVLMNTSYNLFKNNHLDISI